ncbi:MAG: phosphate signaling complex protein PhoU [Bacteroidales bacterium]|nr:phosphate signaling complex protein PhoU [Bacteroidales bacterium]
MKHIEKEINSLKEEIIQMWKLVVSQLEKAKQSFINSDIETAIEIVTREKSVDAFELKIDSDCENYIALYSPVAVDLRLVLSLLKISNSLERIGDLAAGIARHVIEDECNNNSLELIENLQLEEMFDTLISMLSDGLVSLEYESTIKSEKILAKDDKIDQIYHNSIYILSEYITKDTSFTLCGLKLLLPIRKLERIGDLCSNLVEDIVFYVDAIVLKHNEHHNNN